MFQSYTLSINTVVLDQSQINIKHDDTNDKKRICYTMYEGWTGGFSLPSPTPLSPIFLLLIASTASSHLQSYSFIFLLKLGPPTQMSHISHPFYQLQLPFSVLAISLLMYMLQGSSKIRD